MRLSIEPRTVRSMKRRIRIPESRLAATNQLTQLVPIRANAAHEPIAREDRREQGRISRPSLAPIRLDTAPGLDLRRNGTPAEGIASERELDDVAVRTAGVGIAV